VKLLIARRVVQLAALALLVAIPVLNAAGVTFVTGSLYSLAIGPLWITDPLIGLQTFFTTLSVDTKMLVSVLIPVVAALALGRVFCSWVCPQNLISEAVDSVAGRLGVKRLFHPRPTAAPRYVVLTSIMALTALVGLPLASLLSAPGIISVQIARIVSEGTAGLELGLVGAVIVTELFLVRRGWCNYGCPVGGFLGLLRTKRTMKVSLGPDADRACERCGRCAQACQLGLHPVGGRIYPLCHNCGDCVVACGEVTGERKPLSFRF
jgi:ferredoxin-type protein NapH